LFSKRLSFVKSASSSSRQHVLLAQRRKPTAHVLIEQLPMNSRQLCLFLRQPLLLYSLRLLWLSQRLSSCSRLLLCSKQLLRNKRLSLLSHLWRHKWRIVQQAQHSNQMARVWKRALVKSPSIVQHFRVYPKDMAQLRA
jgi:hypothetical protein